MPNINARIAAMLTDEELTGLKVGAALASMAMRQQMTAAKTLMLIVAFFDI